MAELERSARGTQRFRALWASVTAGDVVAGPAILAAVLVAVASYLVGSNRGDIRVDVAMASMASFLFGVLLAFTIVRTRERLALVQNLVAKGNSSLFSIQQMVMVFGEKDRRRVRDLVDGHLTDQIDYRLVDYHLATPSFLVLTDTIYELDPEGPQQEAVYKELVALCINTTADRSLIEAATGQALSAIEWSGLLFLLLVLVALMAVLPGGTVLGAVVVGVLAGTLVTFMVLLRKLDRMRWHERVTIWEPTARLFRSMGRDPYVPRDVIESGRFRPTGAVRVVDYPDPYPLRATKIVRTETLDDDVRPPVAHRGGQTVRGAV